VTGIIVLEVVKNTDRKASQKWLIKTVYSEFNSGMRWNHSPCIFSMLTFILGAWLVDLGVFTPTCSASKRDLPALL